jgi:phospholipase C
VLGGLAALGAGGALASMVPSPAFAALPTRHSPGDRPNPKLPEGTDTLPKIEHIVVLMMENHSFDNYFGVLGRGDGFRRNDHGKPKNTNPDGKGNLIRAFHMPSTCQLDHNPSQAWNASHISLGKNRKNRGFVKASGPVAMGYFNKKDIPFYYSLGRTFPLLDRYFASCLAQTYPNRKFLMAGTAVGQISTDVGQIGKAPPPNGTIFDRLNDHKISWADYATNLPQIALFPPVAGANPDKIKKIDQFYTDAAHGTLPSVSFVDPDFVGHGSEENNADIRVGEQFAARVINAVMHGKAWSKTLLVWTYDEGGGYYDHVTPPKAIKPDNIKPQIQSPPDEPGGYDRYGFRVPAVIVSPYAKKHYVSHKVHDHTSVLKLIETKWNLPALTYRDANASNLLDSVNLHKKPAFLDPPELAEAPGRTDCVEGQPGTIPPASAVIKQS